MAFIMECIRKMAKIVVFGSEGSLMQSVIPKLIAEGHTVFGIDNLFRYGFRHESAKGLDYTYINEDLAESPYEQETLFHITTADYIIQAAARIFGIGGFNAYEADILSYDVAIQHLLLSTLAFSTGTPRPHVIYISSSMVYETCPTIDGGVYEDMVDLFPAPRTAYGLSKYVGERMLKHYSKQYGIPYTIWRPFNIITPHEPADKTEIGISHVFADFIENIVIQKKNPVPIIGDGDQIRCFTWIEDVASGIADNLENPATINETFNLGNYEPTRMVNLAHIIQYSAMRHGILPKDSDVLTFHTVKEYKDDVKIRIPNVEKALRCLDWKSTKNTYQSVDECVKFLLTKPDQPAIINDKLGEATL
jgi:UDP-glucose 4-epimerase